MKTFLREQREERILLEKKHDERLSRLQKQMNDEGVRRATELRAATVQIGSIAAAEQGLRDKQLNDETEKARGELGKKEKSVKSENHSFLGLFLKHIFILLRLFLLRALIRAIVKIKYFSST